MSARPLWSDLPDADAFAVIESLSSAHRPRLSALDQAALVQALRGRSPEAATRIDQSLLGQIDRLRTGLLTAREHLGELEDVLETLRELTATDEEFRSEARALLGVDAA